MSDLGNYVLGILKEKQSERTAAKTEAARKTEFEQELKLRQDDFNFRKQQGQAQLEQSKIANDIASQMHRLQMIEEQSKLVDMAQQGKIIPGAITKPAGNKNGWMQQEVSFPDNIIPSFTSLTPEAAQNKAEQQARVKFEQEKAQKLDFLSGEEQIKSGFRKDEEAAKTKTANDAAIVLENLREKNREDLANLNNNFKVNTSLRGIAEQTENLKPWLKGLADFTTDDKELSLLDKKQRDAIVDTGKGLGFKTPTELTKTELKGVSSTIPTLDNIRRLIDATPSRGTSLIDSAKGEIGGVLDFYSNSELREIYAAVNEQAGLFSRAVGMEKGTTSNADANRAFGIVLDKGASKQAKSRAYTDLVKIIKNKAKTSLVGYHPHQVDSALKLYGIDDIPDTLEKAQEDAVIKKFGGK